ncbi:MAG: restriction endonuclease subunit S [Treponemataceae bacterium]
MTDWKLKELGAFLNLKRGYDLPERDRIPGNIPIVSSSGISGYHNKATAKAPGVVTGRYGTIGEVFYITENYWPLNTALYVENFKNNYPRFSYYLLASYLSANQNAAGAVPGVNRNHLHKIKVKVPPLPVQRKIAAVLSGYDELIENNRRRIALLEKTAEELYREWFVRLRFPGHATAKIVKGVPEGWEVKRVGEIVDRKHFGKTYHEKEVSLHGKIIVIDQSISDFLGFYDGKPEHIASIQDPMILFGDHSCKMQLMFEPFSLGENVIPFRAKNNTPAIFLFFLSYKLIETTEYKRHWSELTNKKCFTPSLPLQIKFSSTVTPNLNKIKNLKYINRQLLASRDRLRSRLMSGKINVEDMDIWFPAGMRNEAE